MEETKFESIQKLDSYIKMAVIVGEQMNDCSSVCVDTVEQMVKLYYSTVAFRDNLSKLSEADAEFEAQKLKNLYEETVNITGDTKQKTEVVGKNLYSVAQGVYDSTFDIEKDYKELTSEEKQHAKESDEKFALREKQQNLANEYSQFIKDNEKTFVYVIKTKENFDKNSMNLANMNFAWQPECLQEIERIANVKFDSFSNINLCIRDIANSSQTINDNIIKNRDNLNYCKTCGDNLGHNFYYLYEVNKNLQQQKQNIQSQNVENIK